VPAPATNQRVCKDFALRPVPSCSAFSFHLPGPGRVRCCYPALSFAAMPQGFAALARGEARRQCGPRLPAPSLESRALKRCISSAVQGGGFTKSGSFFTTRLFFTLGAGPGIFFTFGTGPGMAGGRGSAAASYGGGSGGRFIGVNRVAAACDTNTCTADRQ
jgi:hypothetical protein